MDRLATLLAIGAGGVGLWWLYNQVASRVQTGYAGTLTVTDGYTATAGGLAAPAAPAPAGTSLWDLATQAAVNAGVDPGTFRALVEVESSFDPKAQSSAGAQGLTQLMPNTAAALGVTDPFDPWQNLQAGAHYLAQLLNQFGGNYAQALAAYNAGPGNVAKAIAAGGQSGWSMAMANYQSVKNFLGTQWYVNTILGAAPFS